MASGLKNTIPAVVTNANNITALSVIRSLGREGVPIVGVFGKSRDVEPYMSIVRSSYFISEKRWFDETEYETNCIECLLATGKSLGTKAVLFPVSDHDMALVSKYRTLLQRCYRLLMPSEDMLETLLNKERFYEFANHECLPIPRTFMPRDPMDIAEVGRQVRYPCIIKPSWRTEEWIRRYGNTKVFRCESPAKLTRQFSQVFCYFDKLIVQEIVTGSETNIVCSFTYLDGRSEPLGMFLCRKVRQFPPYFGNTALAEATVVPEVEELTRRICKQLALVGYVSIEFKCDPRDNAYKILEITPARINRQAGLADVCGMNIPYLWYSYLLGLNVKVEISDRPYCWASEVNEARSAGFYFKKKEWTVRSWLKSYRNVRRWEVFARDDILPFLALMLSVLMHRVRVRGLQHWRDTSAPAQHAENKL
jgi:D-aspartate ligase